MSAAIRVPRIGWSWRVDGRAVAVTVALSAAATVALCWSLSVGDFPVPFADVVATLTGTGTPDAAFIVEQLRLPRALVAGLVGIAFGVAGALFQRVLRNPLASPDLIGVNAGAAVGAVAVIVAVRGTSGQVTLGALVGALAAGGTVLALSSRGGVSGLRFVLIGIGATAFLGALTSYLVTRADLRDAQAATVWLTGSLGATTWSHVRPLALAVGVLVPVAVVLARSLEPMDLGDDAASGLGVDVGRRRGALLLVATALAAAGTAASGPIGFVALASPQIARRLTGGRTSGLLAAGATGALVLVAADVLARRALAPTELPVGIVTAVLGAPYLLFLLVRAGRSSTVG